MNTKQSTNLYRRTGSPYWYYDIHDAVTGKRIRRSTKETEYNSALIIYERTTGLSQSSYATFSSPLSQLIRAYSDTSTNPRYKQAQIDGTSYGIQHAQRVACQARYLLDLLKKEAPKLYNKRLSDITKLDIKAIKALLVEDKGRCRQSQNVFQNLKTWFSQASEDGIVEVNVAKDIRNIQYEEKKRIAIEPELLQDLIAARKYFLKDEDWAYFTVLATTGMRRSEALALSTEQISGRFLNIDRALKTENASEIGLPKCNVTRIIPMAKITMMALNAITPSSDGRFFPHGRCWVDSVFHRIQATACTLFPQYSETWQNMTPHTLRHSLNTNLLCAGESPLLVAEYLSWAHQELIDMQTRYTHVYASSMLSVADRIDSLYQKEEEPVGLRTTGSSR